MVSSVKWLEDEHELKALHKPDSRRGAGSEKAATTQRAALSAAIGGLVDASAMSTISGSETYRNNSALEYLTHRACLILINFCKIAMHQKNKVQK